MRIERREHAFHRGVNEVVVTGLVAVHVILAQKLDGFREDRDLGITAVVIAAGRMGGVEADAEQNVEKDQAREGAEQKAALHREKVVSE